MGYRKVKSNYQVMDTATGDLVAISNKEYERWLTLNNLPEEQYPPRVQEILDELDRLDQKAIRPLLEGDTVYLEEIKAQKAALKAELDTY